MTTLNFRPNTNLINPDFNGYRLSTKNIPSYRINLKKECISKSVTEAMSKSENNSSFNMDKIIACSSHNYLIISPFDEKLIFYIDTGYNIMSLSIQNEVHLPDPFPVGKMVRNRRPDVAPTLMFGNNSKTVAVSSDGNETIYFWEIPAAGSNSRWKLLYKKCFDDYQGMGFRVRSLLINDGHQDHDSDLAQQEQFNTRIQIKTVLEIVDKKSRVLLDVQDFIIDKISQVSCSASRICKLISTDTCVNLKYCKLIHGNNLLFISDKEMVEIGTDTSVRYHFEQTSNFIKVRFPRSDDTQDKVEDQENLMEDKTDEKSGNLDENLTFDIEQNFLKFSTKNEISGQLYALIKNHKITADEKYFNFTADKVDTDIFWPSSSVFKNENSDKEDKSSYSGDLKNDFKTPKDIQGEYEECDFNASMANSAAVVYDLANKKITHFSNISGQNLLFPVENNFETDQTTNKSTVCLQADVDGFIYEFQNNQIKHVSTLNAISYVINGKPNLQFKAVSPDYRICVLVDRRIRAYVYHQNVKPTDESNGTESVLRNRKMGKNINEISTQQLVTLPGDLAKEDIVGLQVVRDRFYILTTSSLMIFKV